MAQRVFIGFSTQAIQGKRGWSVSDIDLIKRDLLNEFSTRRGERLMLPTYGTIIWDMLFEPFTDGVQAAIIDDVKTIVGHDPRVRIIDINVVTSANGIKVAIDLKYEPWDTLGTFALDFDRRALERN